MKTFNTFFLCLCILVSCGKDDSTNEQKPDIVVDTEMPEEKGFIADFNSDKQKIKVNETVTFNDLSKGDIVSRAWTFSGGTPSISETKSPSITYKEEGVFDVSLKIKSTTNEIIELKKGYIEVTKDDVQEQSGDIPNDYVLRLDFNNDVTDKSRHSNPTEPINFSYTADRDGKVNSAGAFLSSSKSNIKVPHSNSISLDKEMTISLWFYYEKQFDNSFFTLVEKTNPADGGHSRYGMWVYNEGIIEVCIEPDNCPGRLCQQCLDAQKALELNTWYHLAGVFDGKTLKIYIDGEENASSDVNPSGISQTQYELYVGTDPYNGIQKYLTGRMDNLRIYNRALSNSEIDALFKE